MFSLVHASMEPIIYSFVITYGLCSMAKKVQNKRYFAFIVEVSIFALIFLLHGHSVTGGFASTIASVIAGNMIAKMLEPCFNNLVARVKAFFTPRKTPTVSLQLA